MSGAYKLLRSGVCVEIDRPDPGVIRLDDIAHNLAMLCRYGGACDRHLSVAQHCVLVSEMCEYDGIDPRWGLLHDAAEYILGDMATPIKRLMRDDSGSSYSLYDALELLWQEAICERFKIAVSPSLRQRTKFFDIVSMLWEVQSNGPRGLTASQFIGRDAREYLIYLPIYDLTPWDAERAEREYLSAAARIGLS